ncbi:MAG: Flp family type IVb pilin [Kiloniellaceae bacterium]|nr:Flp family type IVb pilin [Kiloniellaceae bacterium]
MRNFFKGLWQDESGAAAAEYALILAVIAVGIALVAIALGTNIEEAIRLACGSIASGVTAGGGTAAVCP